MRRMIIESPTDESDALYAEAMEERFNIITAYLQECVDEGIMTVEDANEVANVAYSKYITESEFMSDGMIELLTAFVIIAIPLVAVGTCVGVGKAVKNKLLKALNIYAKVYDKDVINFKDFDRTELTSSESKKEFPSFVEKMSRFGDASIRGYKYTYNGKIMCLSIEGRRSYSENTGHPQIDYKLVSPICKKNSDYYKAAMAIEYDLFNQDTHAFIKNTKKRFKEEIKRIKKEEKANKKNK